MDWPPFAVVTADRWTLLAAKLFGRRIEASDSGTTVVGYQWRGNIYMTEIRERNLT